MAWTQENGAMRVLRNAVMWSAAWALVAGTVLGVIAATGNAPASATWPKALGLVGRFAIIGGVAGVVVPLAVSSILKWHDPGRIGWVRYGLAGGIGAAVFVPLFLQAMNVLSGDGLVAWPLVLDDAPIAAVLGALAALAVRKWGQVQRRT